MNILITGATGRVGRNLVENLVQDNKKIRALVLPNDPNIDFLSSNGVECVLGNLNDKNAVNDAVDEIDTIVHLAAVMFWDPDTEQDVFQHNVEGTFNLLHAASKRIPKINRFFIASSDEVYPSLKSHYSPIDEAHPKEPYSFYGLSKEINEKMAFYYYRSCGLPVTVARFALVAEAHEILRPDGWSGRFLFVNPMRNLFSALGRDDAVKSIDDVHQSSEDTLILLLDDNGKPYVFHFCDVRDLVQGIILQLEKPEAIGEIFNLSGPAPFSYRVAIEELHKHTKIPYVTVKVSGDPIKIIHDISKAKSMLGFDPKYDVLEIIQSAVK